MAEFDEYDRNEVEDTLAQRYLPALRRGMAKIRSQVPA